MAPPSPPNPAMPIDAHHWLCDDAIDWESMRDEAALTRDDSWTGLTRGAAIIFFSSAAGVFAGIVAHVTLGFGFGFFSASFALGTIPGLLGTLGHRAAEARSLQAGLAWRAAIEQRSPLSSREALSALLLLMDMAARLDLEAAGFSPQDTIFRQHRFESRSCEGVALSHLAKIRPDEPPKPASTRKTGWIKLAAILFCLWALAPRPPLPTESARSDSARMAALWRALMPAHAAAVEGKLLERDLPPPPPKSSSAPFRI